MRAQKIILFLAIWICSAPLFAQSLPPFCTSPLIDGVGGLRGHLNFDPANPSSAEPITITAGRWVFIPTSISADVQDRTIDVYVTGQMDGFTTPRGDACLSTSLAPLPAGTYTVNVYSIDTTLPNDPPLLFLSRALAVADGGSLPAANLIPNPDFTNGVEGWTTITAGNGTATLDNSTGAPDAPSIRLVANPANSDVTVASSCVQVDDGDEVFGFFNLRGNAGAAALSIETFSDTACTTALSSIAWNPIEANQVWTTYAFEGVQLPDGAMSARVLLTATEGSDASAGDANFDHVQLGQSGSVSGTVNVNQEGLTGTWYDPLTSGQGMQFTFDPDTTTPGAGTLFGTWYTYDTTSGDESSQRWYSVQAVLDGDANGVGVDIYQNVGGNFDAPPATSAVRIGVGSLFFDSCQSGTFIYSFDDGRTGSIPLTRIMPNADCVETGTPTITPSDFGLSGTWYDPATAGQGLLIEVNPDNAYAFFGWYTYAASGESSGVAGQRWFTAQAPYTVGTHVIDLTVYDSTGGTFDSSNGVVQTTPVGTATLSYTSCSSATLDYTFTAGELSGQRGSIALSRLGNAPASCPVITR